MSEEASPIRGGIDLHVGTNGTRTRSVISYVYYDKLMLSNDILALDMARSPAPTTTPTLEAAQRAGFPLGGEPLAVDLANTVVTTAHAPMDLLGDSDACARFWSLQRERLPDGWEVPTLSATRELRDAIRRILDAIQVRGPIDPRDVDLVNRSSAGAPTSFEATMLEGEVARVERWHAESPTALPLAVAARSAIEILADSGSVDRLRRCANPACSMLFLNGDSRRRWCTANVCGNRVRVARHYRRQREA